MDQITAENSALLEKTYRTTVIVILAQIATTIVLTVVALIIVTGSDTSDNSQSLTTLWVAMLFLAIGSFVLRRLFFGWERLQNAVLLSGIGGLLGNLRTNSIILGALAEIIAILGFVVALLSGSSLDMFRATAISLIVFLINFPRKKVWKTIVTSLQGV